MKNSDYELTDRDYIEIRDIVNILLKAEFKDNPPTSLNESSEIRGKIWNSVFNTYIVEKNIKLLGL